VCVCVCVCEVRHLDRRGQRYDVYPILRRRWCIQRVAQGYQSRQRASATTQSRRLSGVVLPVDGR
jgi:hypothetical protein